MANPTTNYGFVLPSPTDLVTDLPADFDVALQGVDTRLKALNPSTTLGDLGYASATANTNTRLGIGTSGQVLTSNGSVPSWQTSSSGGETLLSTTTLSGSSTTISSIPTTYKHLRAIIVGVYGSSQNDINIRFNGDTGSHYNSGFSFGTNNAATSRATTSAVILQSYNLSDISFQAALDLNIPRYSITTGTQMFGFNGWAGQGQWGIGGGGTYINKSAAITSITFLYANGTFTAGTVFLYGVN